MLPKVLPYFLWKMNHPPISLSNYCNASLSEPYPESGGTPHWDDGSVEALGQLTLEDVSARGIPFLLGSQLIVLPAPTEGEEAGKPIAVPVGKQAHYVCIAHCCAMRPDDGMGPSIGDEVARYVLVYADGSQHSVSMRRRFEICPLRNPLGRAFVATTMGSPRPLRGDEQGAWGWRQTGVGGDGLPGIWIYALPNPDPEKKLDNIKLECLAQDGVAVFGITLAHFPDHPLRHWPRNTFRISLPEGKEVLMSAVSVDLDMGHITRMYPDPGFDEEKWLEDQQAGLGTEAQREPQPIRNLMVEATGSKAASFQIQLEDEKLELSYGEASHPSGAGVELCHPHKTWVHVKIVDEETGQSVATRARFLGPRGEYLPPYGHPADVNTNWFEDEGGNIEWLDTLSIKADEESHQRLRSVFTSAESKHRKKMEGHSSHHTHHH